MRRSPDPATWIGPRPVTGVMTHIDRGDWETVGGPPAEPALNGAEAARAGTHPSEGLDSFAAVPPSRRSLEPAILTGRAGGTERIRGRTILNGAIFDTGRCCGCGSRRRVWPRHAAACRRRIVNPPDVIERAESRSCQLKTARPFVQKASRFVIFHLTSRP